MNPKSECCSAPEAFPADPVLPRLGLAMDSAWMRRVFSEHVAALGPERLQVEACRVDRIRYRRGERCVLQYALSLRDAKTGLSRQSWVAAGVYASDRLQQVWTKVQCGSLARPCARHTGAGVSLVPDLGMVVHFFPHDRRLPTLERLTAAPPPEMAAALLREFGPGRWQAERWTIETVRYRAELAATLRYAAHARETETGRTRWMCFYVKVYRDNGAASHAALSALWRQARGRGADPFVARPIAWFPELGAVVQAEVPGVSFEELLCHGRDPVSAARRVAQTLARLHLDGIGSDGYIPPRYSVSDEIATARRAARLLGWACPGRQADLDGIAGALAASLDGVPLRPTHRDLKAEHLRLDGDRVSVIDVDSLALANPLIDLASLLADVARLRGEGRLSADGARTAAGALIGEYFRHAPAHSRERLPGCYAGAAMNRALHFFQRQQPDWSAHLRAMVDDAQAALAGRVWW
jgi:hypothetical protein